METKVQEGTAEEAEDFEPFKDVNPPESDEKAPVAQELQAAPHLAIPCNVAELLVNLLEAGSAGVAFTDKQKKAAGSLLVGLGEYIHAIHNAKQ